MFIFRIEDKEGNGPYNNRKGSSPSYAALGCIHDGFEEEDWDSFPLPEDDKGIDREIIEDVEKCAFISFIQLNQWFGAGRRSYLRSKGFTIVLLWINRKYVTIGKFQALYVCDRAFLLWRQK